MKTLELGFGEGLLAFAKIQLLIGNEGHRKFNRTPVGQRFVCFPGPINLAFDNNVEELGRNNCDKKRTFEASTERSTCLRHTRRFNIAKVA